jgi:hypothetical protein
MGNKFKARASMAGLLMTEPRTKQAKENGELSESAKTFVRNAWLKNNFFYEDVVMTHPMMKGLLCEHDAVAMMNEFIPTDDYRSLNTHAIRQSLEDDYFTGSFDTMLKLDDVVEDIKCPFTVETYFNATLTKQYYTQVQVYMRLAGVTKGRLVYCLVDTPEPIVLELEKAIWFKYGANDDNTDYITKSQQIRHNHKPSTYIPAEQRIKYYEFERNDAWLDELIARVGKAQEFYDSLSLNQIDDSEVQQYMKA